MLMIYTIQTRKSCQGSYLMGQTLGVMGFMNDDAGLGAAAGLKPRLTQGGQLIAAKHMPFAFKHFNYQL
jgi:hypothetical protein